MKSLSSPSKRWKTSLKKDKIKLKLIMKNLNKPSSQWLDILKLTWMKFSWKLWKKVKKIWITGISSKKRKPIMKKCIRIYSKWREKQLDLGCSKKEVNDFNLVRKDQLKCKILFIKPFLISILINSWLKVILRIL